MDKDQYLKAKDGDIARKSGLWAKRKHHYLGNYCGITTRSMRNKFRLVYIDVMAGPGICKIKGTGEEFPGSPFIALEHDFAEYLLIEADPDLADILRKRVARHPKAARVKVITENWGNLAEAGGLCFDQKNLVVAFVDPTGISQIPMSAMRALARSPRIDLLVTIQYRLGIVWNAPQYFKTENETVLDAFLDLRDWREWNWRDASDFGRLTINRFSKNMAKEGFIGARHVSVPEDNPLYRFTLFSRHPKGEEFWNKILLIDEQGQRELL